MVCKHCGKEFDGARSVCPYCGTAADGAAQAEAPQGAAAVCKNCGRPLQAGDAFCPHCGARADAPQESADVCKNCGQPLQAGDAFCPGCGETVRQGAGFASAPQPQGAVPNQPYMPAPAQPRAPAAADAKSGGFFALGFFFPLIGLILFLVWKDQLPLRASEVVRQGRARRIYRGNRSEHRSGRHRGDHRRFRVYERFGVRAALKRIEKVRRF